MPPSAQDVCATRQRCRGASGGSRAKFRPGGDSRVDSERWVRVWVRYADDRGISAGRVLFPASAAATNAWRTAIAARAQHRAYHCAAVHGAWLTTALHGAAALDGILRPRPPRVAARVRRAALAHDAPHRLACVCSRVETRWDADGNTGRCPSQERTRALLAECASLLTAQGTEGPPPDIDVTSALIPTLPQAIAAAIAQVRKP